MDLRLTLTSVNLTFSQSYMTIIGKEREHLLVCPLFPEVLEREVAPSWYFHK